jgi:hypothetical protein
MLTEILRILEDRNNGSVAFSKTGEYVYITVWDMDDHGTERLVPTPGCGRPNSLPLT